MNLRETAMQAIGEGANDIRDAGSRERKLAKELSAITEAIGKSREWFGESPCRVAADIHVIPQLYYDGGISLHYAEGEFWLGQACPHCGDFCWSLGIRSLYMLGRMLEKFTPSFDHVCHSSKAASPPSPVTIQQQILTGMKAGTTLTGNVMMNPFYGTTKEYILELGFRQASL